MPRPKKSLEAAIALVAKDLLENNQNIADVGTIIGALGEDSLKWLTDLKKECSSVDEFIEIASKRADIALIAAAVKCALGYEYEESYQNYLKVPDGYNKDGSPRMRDVPSNRQVKTKRALPNEALLRFILKCRLPEYFHDIQRVEINKKTIEIKELAGREIEEFGRKFLELAKNGETEK
ncbi:MAG: hypothetical protein QQN41_12990 [Nitrosopumilus sp.]